MYSMINFAVLYCVPEVPDGVRKPGEEAGKVPLAAVGKGKNTLKTFPRTTALNPELTILFL